VDAHPVAIWLLPGDPAKLAKWQIERQFRYLHGRIRRLARRVRLPLLVHSRKSHTLKLAVHDAKVKRPLVELRQVFHALDHVIVNLPGLTRIGFGEWQFIERLPRRGRDVDQHVRVAPLVREIDEPDPFIGAGNILERLEWIHP